MVKGQEGFDLTPKRCRISFWKVVATVGGGGGGI